MRFSFSCIEFLEPVYARLVGSTFKLSQSRSYSDRCLYFRSVVAAVCSLSRTVCYRYTFAVVPALQCCHPVSAAPLCCPAAHILLHLQRGWTRRNLSMFCWRRRISRIEP